MTDVKVRAERPLSPHLQIYRFTWTMAMSIMHRITGAALYAGTILLALWLLGVAGSQDSFDAVQWLMGSIFGMLVLFLYTWTLIHHMLGGIRHFVWDVGLGFGADTRQNLARLNLIGSVSLTVIVWVAVFLFR